MTPDWSAQAEPVPYAKLDDPQSLNLYSYVLNNPVSLTDADGHFVGPKDNGTGGKFATRAENQSTAVPLKDDKGDAVRGANGRVALVPGTFDVRAVVSAGLSDFVLRVEAPPVGDAATVKDLLKFRRGGKWDLQRLKGKFDSRYIDSATILIGMYAASTGIRQGAILSIENFVARGGKYRAGTVMDATYTHLPARNVEKTRIGFRLVASGAITGD